MSKKALAVIILAAGNGSRMKSALPKVMHPLGGRPLIEHVILTAKQLNPKHIITVLQPNMESVKASIENISEIAIQKEQLGTGDAVKPALELLQGFKGTILILYADTPLITVTTLTTLYTMVSQQQADIGILGFKPQDTGMYARIEVDKNQENIVSRIIEFKDANEKELKIPLCNSGIIASHTNALPMLVTALDNNNAKGEYYLTDIVRLGNQRHLISKFVLCSTEELLGINNRYELSLAEQCLQKRLRLEAMQEGITLIDPDTIYLAYGTKFGRDVTIHPHVVIGKDVTIEDNVEIKSFSHLEGAHIYNSACIGPFARIRPGTVIEDHVKIGNFVEIKKSEIKSGSKVNHLSYIGDSEIDSDSNIGAGTVTCNYDGYNKYKTHIGKNVFIGSNTSLVAPLHIADGAMVGAGSTITENIPPDALGIARSKQIIKEKRSKSYQRKKSSNP